MSTQAHLEIWNVGEVAAVRVEGELDFSNVADVGRRMRDAVLNEATGLVLDLSTVRYIDSAGVKMLFDLVTQLGACRQGIAIVLTDGSPVRRLLEITKIDLAVPVLVSVESAVETLNARADRLL